MPVSPRTPRGRRRLGRRFLLLVSVVALGLAACTPPPPAPGLPGFQYGPRTDWGFPDPFVLKVGNTWHAYATNWSTGSVVNVPYMTSTDLVHWTFPKDAMRNLASWAIPGETWAPTVRKHKNIWFLYYSAKSRNSGVRCVAYATAKKPQGPFVDRGRIVCQPQDGGAIDPSVFVNYDGRLYLQWKTEGVANRVPTKLWSQQLTSDGRALINGTRGELLRTALPWEGSVIENPALVAHAGGYWLFYSANAWWTTWYGTGVARCSRPIGPCARVWSTPSLFTTWNIVGPGGPSVTHDAFGRPLLAYHSWHGGERKLFFSYWNVFADRVYIL